MKLSENIIGERIVLSRPELSFGMAENIYTIVDSNREHFLPYLGWVKSTEKPEDSFLFLSKADKDWQEEKQFVYMISLKENNQLIGLISVINVAFKHNRTEIGYWLDKKFTKKGYMQEAVTLIEKELFDKGFNRIVIHTDILNVESAKVPTALGYKHEGVLRNQIYSTEIGRYRDMNVFAKLKADK